jgi:hypothetical protein
VLVRAGQLSELLYESTHLRRDIAHQNEFRSGHEQVELASVDAMRASQAAASGPAAPSPSSDPSDHQQMLELLAFELDEREKLATQASELAERRAALEAEVAAKRRKLKQALPAALAGLRATASPLVSAFTKKKPPSPSSPSKASAALSPGIAGGGSCQLPMPLFSLLAQFESHRDALEPTLQVRLVGDSGSDGGARGGAGESAPKQPRLGLSPQEACRAHGQSVEVVLPTSRGRLSLSFQHLPMLGLVTADGQLEPAGGAGAGAAGGGKRSAELLGELYAGDTGEDVPNPAAVHVLGTASWAAAAAAAGQPLSSPKGGGRPYRWAQQLAGLRLSRPVRATHQTEVRSARPLAADARSVLALILGAGAV